MSLLEPTARTDRHGEIQLFKGDKCTLDSFEPTERDVIYVGPGQCINTAKVRFPDSEVHEVFVHRVQFGTRG